MHCVGRIDQHSDASRLRRDLMQQLQRLRHDAARNDGATAATSKSAVLFEDLPSHGEEKTFYYWLKVGVALSLPLAAIAIIVGVAASLSHLAADLINLAAIQEYGEQSERKVYLDAQNADLVEAIGTLEDAIRKIDLETRQLLGRRQLNLGIAHAR